MGRNKRRVYGEDAGRDNGLTCADCGCGHFDEIGRERTGGGIRVTRACRNCGREVSTAEKEQRDGF